MNDYIPTHKLLTGNLRTSVYENRGIAGAAAARDAVGKLRKLLADRDRVRMVFAAAPSQNEFLDCLVAEPDIDWTRIEAFHMDEYIGLSEQAPQRFGKYLQDRLFDRVHPGAVYLLNPQQGAAEEIARYEALLGAAPIDMVCLGIGENGHLAFNDPPVADFNDPKLIKEVELDLACRLQQVNDGCFTSLEAVPLYALTLTIPALMSATHLVCIVPGERKREAIKQTLRGEISTEWPSTILRTHPDCSLYTDSAGFEG
jgi:glucosamine-6-phosphate deaminase